jgi:hypothetical protein
VERPAVSTPPKSAEENHSRRTEDMSAESELARFLDENFYDHFPNADAFDSIERIYNKNLQLSGIDVVFNAKDGRTFRIDEKAQLYYLNKDLPTFRSKSSSFGMVSPPRVSYATMTLRQTCTCSSGLLQPRIALRGSSQTISPRLIAC